jgi:hypothetical protein
MSDTLGQIREDLGELRGSVKAIEQYVHEGRHGTNNLSQKIDALAVKITSDMASVEARLDGRLRRLETNAAGDERSRSILVTFLQSPLLAWIFAAAVVFWSWVTTGGHKP